MELSAPDYGGFERRKADVEYGYGRDSATNAYGRFISQQRGSRQLGDLTRGFQRSYPGQRAGLAQRGLSGPGVSSGVQRQAMDRFIGDYGRQYGRTQQDFTQQLQQFDLEQSNLDQYRQAALQAIEADKANQIAQTAENLEYIRTLIGGL